MDSSYVFWNNFKITSLGLFQQIIFWQQLDPSFVGQLESCLLTARQHGSHKSHINRRFSNTFERTVIVVQ